MQKKRYASVLGANFGGTLEKRKISAFGEVVIRQKLDEDNKRLGELRADKQNCTGGHFSAGEMGRYELSEHERDEEIISARVNLLSKVLEHSAVVPAPTTCEKVQIGTAVEVKLDSGRTTSVLMGGPDEPSYDGLLTISYLLPFGRSLRDKSVGDYVEWNTPTGEHWGTITRIWIPKMPNTETASVPLKDAA